MIRWALNPIGGEQCIADYDDANIKIEYLLKRHS